MFLTDREEQFDNFQGRNRIVGRHHVTCIHDFAKAKKLKVHSPITPLPDKIAIIHLLLNLLEVSITLKCCLDMTRRVRKVPKTSIRPESCAIVEFQTI